MTTLSSRSNSIPRTILLVVLLIVVALGIIVSLGIWRTPVPVEAQWQYMWLSSLPEILSFAIAAGLHLCAIGLILLAALSVIKNQPVEQPDINAIRKSLLVGGATYISAVYVTTLLLGVGLIKSPEIFAHEHLPARLSAYLAMAIGILLVINIKLPGLLSKGKFGSHVVRLVKMLIVPALALLGVLIGLCTVSPRSSVYLGVINLLSIKRYALRGYELMVLYSLIFVVPLIAVLLISASRDLLSRVVAMNQQSPARLRFVLGFGALVLGALLLILV